MEQEKDKKTKAAEQEKHNIELRTERIQELLGAAPGRLISYGISIVFGVVALLVGFAAVFRYPETYQATVNISAEHPAAWIVAQASGRIEKVYVSNLDTVRKGELLGVIHNSADMDDIFRLKRYVGDIAPFMSSFDIPDLPPAEHMLRLGDLQDIYAQLSKLLSEYSFFCREDLHRVRCDAIRAQLKEYDNYLKIAQEQNRMKGEAIKLGHNRYSRDSILRSMRGTSATEFEKSRQQYIAENVEFNQTKMQITSTMLEMQRLRQQLSEAEIDYRNTANAYRSNIGSLYEQLISRIEGWENAFTLKAPADGVVNFISVWSPSHNVAAGERVFAVVPLELGNVVGKCTFSVSGMGKIKEGQKVSVKLDGYPYMEYGVLQGRIKSIAAVPVEVTTQTGTARFVSTEIDLDNGFISSYGTEIPFTGELTGVAEITIQEMTLLQHFLNPLKHLWNNNIGKE